MEEHPLDNSSNQSDTRVIDVIIYNKANEMPTAHMFLGSNFQKVQLLQIRHFWIFEIDNLTPDITSLEFHISPECGPTNLYTTCFTENQPFAFIDTLPDNEMIPFGDFLLFFNTAIGNKSLSFKFQNDNTLLSIEQFVRSFDDKYFLWALMYIASQPWYEIFQYNEDISQFLISEIIPYIGQHFFEPQMEQFQLDFKSYIMNLDIPLFNINNNSNFKNQQLTENPLPCQQGQIDDPTKYLSAESYIDTLFQFLRVQIGDGYVYILSLFFDFDNDFPFTSYIPLLENYRNSRKVGELLSSFIQQFNIYDGEELIQVYEKLYYCILMTSTVEFDMDLAPLLKVLDTQLNMQTIAKIINDRMILTRYQSADALKFIVEAVPHFDHVLEVFKSKETFLPIEWVHTLSEITELGDPAELIINSLRNSVPSHYQKYFANVTSHGALIHDENFDDSKTVLQPGAIVQLGAQIGDHTMMMTGSIALSGSTLEANTFARRNGIIPRDLKVVSESAIFQHPVVLKRGVTIDDGAIICQSSSVGSGTKVCANAVIGPLAQIGSGCIITEGEKVLEATELPAGFRYSRDIVEFEQKIPEVIQRYSFMFLKRYTGFADLPSVLSFDKVQHKDAVLKQYFECVSGYPREAGRQMSLCRNSFGFLDDVAIDALIGEIYAIFGSNAILLAGSYWAQIDDIGVGEKGNDNVCDRIVRELCSRAIWQFSLSLDDLRNERVIYALKQISDSIPLMKKRGVSDENIDYIRQTLFNRCDHALLRLKLTNYPPDSPLYTLLKSIHIQTKLLQ